MENNGKEQNISVNGQPQYLKTIPRYQHIYEYLLGEISTGKLKPGDNIPSEKELCETFQVSRITSKKALEMLVESNLITRYRGKGSFVSGISNMNETEKFASSFLSIAFLIPAFNDSFGNRLLSSVEAACEAHGYHLILKITHESTVEEEKALRAAYDRNVAGILMLPAHGEYYNAEILRQILSKRPLVFIDRKMRGLPVPSVTTDCVNASETAVKWLLKQGHRNIAFFSGSKLHTSTVEDRLYGFNRAFVSSKIPLNPVYICDNLPSLDSFDIILRHLNDHPEITAAFTAEFEIALLVKQALAVQNRQVPRDFAIVTYDHPGYSGEFSDFSCLIQDEGALGKHAVEILHRIIQGEPAESMDNIMIPAELVHGKTVTSFLK